MSIGRNPLGALRRMAAPANVHLAEPRTSTLELIERAAAVVTISSTVGLEAVMLQRPVLTLSRPFYSGYGVTMDVEDRADLPEHLPELLAFEPDLERSRRLLHAAKRRCHPGAPVLVDSSDENAESLADTLDRAARNELDLSRPRHNGG